ncbi:MAG TPA: YihY/virulence factor BrkB family protein [Casimicrobiaceae bacterium]|nr:YihY/virulence factor BrkB family protein [Casimicrobiaceae bacterium]
MRWLWSLVKRTVTSWQDDYAQSMGAALAYYTVFSVAPVLVIVVAVAGLFFGQHAAQGELFLQLRDTLGDEGAAAVQALVKSANSPRGGVLAGIVGVIVLVVGATTVFAELQTSLDRIWRVPLQRKNQGIWHTLRGRLLAFGLVLVAGLMLFVSIVIGTAIHAFARWWGRIPGGWHQIIEGMDIVISMVLTTTLFAMIYKWMPRAKVAWHDVWMGAGVTAVLFEIGKLLIGVYVGKAAIGSAFGAAGSLVVLLVWVYYSAQIFLLGAEFTWVYANDRREREGAYADPATTQAEKTDVGARTPSQLEAAGVEPQERVASRRRS